MAVAQVVPLRRLPSDRSVFDYHIPAGLEVTVGHIVTVPFLRSRISAIVWGIADSSPVKDLKDIIAIVRPEPVMTPWQRRVAEAIRAQTFVSLGHILDGVIPRYSGRSQDETTSVHQPTPPERSSRRPEPSTWWYRSRQHQEDELKTWVDQDEEYRLIITPTIEDAERLGGQLQASGKTVAIAHRQLNTVPYRQLYERVRHGRVRHVIGTASALLLPFPVAPRVVIDQEDHPGHKAVLRSPRYDIRHIVADLQVLEAVTTVAPSVWWYDRHRPDAPPRPTQRRLVRLDQPRDQLWLTPDLTDCLDRAMTEHRQVALIVPRRGYAGAVRCRQCGYGVTCPVCQHSASLIGRPPEPLRCQSCGQITQAPVRCPRCQSIDWHFSGLGPERMAELLSRRWSCVVADQRSSLLSSATAVIGTYQLYRRLADRHFAAVVIVHGDALLNVPDFSADERAWQYLARLEAVQPSSLIMVQSFHAEQDFWQRWLGGQDRTWYTDELAVRKRLGLPPLADQWLVRLPSSQPATILDEKISELRKKFGDQLIISTLPARSGRSRGQPRLLLTSVRGLLHSFLDPARLFPSPWQVETVVTSWLD